MKRKMMKMKYGLAAVLLFAFAAMLSAQELWHVIDAERFRRMSQFERVQYQKAFDLLRSNQFRAAAAEFDRFQTQFRESEVLPYMVFLRAYALHQAKDRFRAISVYNEVIDFYPGEIDAAAPAMYYKGMAQFDNGDYSKGMTTMKELLDDEDYSEHKVAAAASLQLVRNHWKNKEPDKAEQYLKKIYAGHRGTRAAEDAKNHYAASCACTGKLNEYTAWYLATFREEAMEKKITGAELRVKMLTELFELLVYHHNYHNYFQRDDLILMYRGGKRGPDPFGELWKLLLENQAAYDRAGKMWDFYYQTIRLNAAKSLEKNAAFEKRISDAVKFILSVPDDEKNKDRQQSRLATLVDQLYYCHRWDHGAYVNTRIKDPKKRAWNEFLALDGKGKWDDALKQLDAIAAKFPADAALVKNALWRKAGIYHYRKGMYDEAIKAYREIGEPPRTLWEVAECQKRKKDSQAAIMTYIEIENSFQNTDGAEAAWRRASYYKQLGESKKAIAEARRLLKVYPKSRQASWSHQMLESMGIDETGLGAGVDDEDF